MSYAPFRVVHGAGPPADLVRNVLSDLGPVPWATVGFVYATDAVAAEMESLVEALRQATGVPHWVGGSAIGVLADGAEYFDQPALAVMVAGLPAEEIQVFGPIRATGDLADLALADSGVALIHADPRDPELPQLIDLLDRATGAYVVGGLVSGREVLNVVCDQVVETAMGGVLMSENVPVRVGVTQGCAPIGPWHHVSACENNLVYSLDDRPSLDVFREDIGELLARDMRRAEGYIHVAVPVAGSDTDDYMVRNLLGVDGGRGVLAIGDLFQPGDRLRFVRRDGGGAAQDLRRMLRGLKRRLDGPPRGGIYIDCLARGPNLFGHPGAETGMIHQILGDFPLIGYFANGEFAGAHLYGYTGVLILFT